MFHFNCSATKSHILCVSIQQNREVIKERMHNKVLMEGNVNGHCFTIEGDGEGKPYE